jgi:hypothetical protein
MRNFELHEDFEIEGIWSLADESVDRTAGTLRYRQSDGAVLSLIGHFDRSDRGSMPMTHEDDTWNAVVYGFTKNGQEISLLETHRVRSSLSAPGFAVEEWSSNFLIIGKHIDNLEIDEFQESRFRFDGIEDWLNHEIFTTRYEGSLREITVTAKNIERKVLGTCRDFDLYVSSEIYAHENSAGEATLSGRCYFEIIAHHEKSIKWHLEIASRLRDLSSLCYGRHLNIESISVKNKLVTGEKSYRNSDYFYIYPRYHYTSKRTSRRYVNKFASLNDLLTNNASVFQSWLDQYDTIKPCLDLFFVLRSRDNGILHVKFLLSIQAVEVFHRLTSDNTVVRPPSI